jgi:CHASE3 domain sensor protein
MWKLFLILGACLAVAFFAAFVWQQTEKNSREDEANKHAEIATNLEAAVADGLGAGTTLSEYVQTGNPELLPVMQAKSDEGVRQLTAAITAAGSDPNGFVKTGSAIVQRSGEVIALRQAGDVPGAGAALQALSNHFGTFVQQQRDFIAQEREAAAASRASADDANQLSTWFMIAGAIISLAVAGGAAVSVFRRKRPLPLPA